MPGIDQQMANDARRIAQSDHRRPFQVGTEGILAPGRAHERHAGGRPDGEQAAAYSGRQRHQQPLAVGHLRRHGQYGEHDRYVVHDGRQNAHHGVGPGGSQVVIHELGNGRQVTELGQAAYAENDPVKKEQRIPLSLGNAFHNIKLGRALLLGCKILQHFHGTDHVAFNILERQGGECNPPAFVADIGKKGARIVGIFHMGILPIPPAGNAHP